MEMASNESSNETGTSVCDALSAETELSKVYYAMLPSAVAIIILLMILETKKQKSSYCTFQCSKPKIVYPVNSLQESENVLMYVVAFTVVLLSLLITTLSGSNDGIGILVGTSISLAKALGGQLEVLTMALVGFLQFPVFACFSSKHVVGHCLGIGYVLLNIAFDVWRITLFLLQAEPFDVLTCSLWLWLLRVFFSAVLFLGFYAAILKKTANNRSIDETHLWNYDQRHCVAYVRHLFAKRKETSEKDKLTVRKSGFRFGLPICIAVALSIASVLIIVVYILLLISSVFNLIRDLDMTLPEQGMINATGLLVVDEVIFWIMGPLQVASLLLMIPNYKNNMLRLYRGDPLLKKKVAPRAILASYSKFVGYQVAFAGWAATISGYMVQVVVLLIVNLAVAVIVVLAQRYDLTGPLYKIARILGPVIFTAIMAQLVTLVLHWIFLVKLDGKRVLALRNRKAFFNFEYFSLFFTVLGLFTALNRIILSAGAAILLLPRTDRTPLPPGFEFLDGGYSAYISMLRMQNVQTNPTMLCFCSLLWSSCGKTAVFASELDTAKIPNGIFVKVAEQRRVSNILARNRWFFAWTLLANPSLVKHRRRDDRKVNKTNCCVKDVKCVETRC